MTKMPVEDWWDLGEQLAQLAAEVAEIELPPATHERLVCLVVDFATLLTCWPTSGQPAARLRYLRLHPERMAPRAPWLYRLPPATRKLLTGTDRHPSLLVLALRSADPERAPTRLWRRGLEALMAETEVAT